MGETLRELRALQLLNQLINQLEQVEDDIKAGHGSRIHLRSLLTSWIRNYDLQFSDERTIHETHQSV